jgi:dihydroneopterin aldolase
MALMDSITLSPIEINTIIGILPQERITPQPLMISVTLFFDMTEAVRTDSVDSTVNYAEVLACVLSFSDSHHCELLETFAGRLADLLLSSFPLLQSVSLVIEKPQVFGGKPLVTLNLTRHN